MAVTNAANIDTTNQTHLPADTNQALGIAQYAIDFVHGTIGSPDDAVFDRVNRLLTDSVFCGLSAIALGTNAPCVFRQEAGEYPDRDGVPTFGSTERCKIEKAIVANTAAVREWDSNGTNFGYNPTLGHTAGEFGHNDFYPVAIAACQAKGLDGDTVLRAMVALDEIRGRLAEVFSLKTYKIDHVVHGAIASAAVFGAIMGATAEQIESAIGMTVAHYVPFRAIRAGKQLSDSKGSSAAITTEAAVLSMQRSMMGFVGPKDIFRNPEAIFRFFEPTDGDCSPFDLVLSHTGSDFALMGMHFKLGLYEHQSAGALQGLVNLLLDQPELLDDATGSKITNILVKAYEPAFGIIGDPAKRDPKTRQSADHSMVYIVATMLRKALDVAHADDNGSLPTTNDAWWKAIMLSPYDYNEEALNNPTTRTLMDKIAFEHGGPAYDEKYPDGIPTSLIITDKLGATHDSGLVMYPIGHARNTTADLDDVLSFKFQMLGTLAVADPDSLISRFELAGRSATDIANLYDFVILDRGQYE